MLLSAILRQRSESEAAMARAAEADAQAVEDLGRAGRPADDVKREHAAQAVVPDLDAVVEPVTHRLECQTKGTEKGQDQA
jgi:hypothetical protein